MSGPLVPGLALAPDGRPRCAWAVSAADYLAYHDEEWGRPVRDEDGLFERLCLEGFQSGLSWLTILRKRENFRAAFAGFSIARVAAFGPGDEARLLADPGIVRNGAKVRAAMANARAAQALHGRGRSLAEIVWAHAAPSTPRPLTGDDVPAITPESRALAKALKAEGFAFVGPTTALALMQACGVVDHHVAGCVAGAPQRRAGDPSSGEGCAIAG